jgi:4-amino-4-deoxy-L-arabinose transferase-like glycosyltransferase
MRSVPEAEVEPVPPPAVRPRVSRRAALAYLSRERSWILARAALVAAALVVSGAWIGIDHRTPEWDQAYYLDLTYHYVTALHGGGLGGLLQQIWSPLASHPPLFTVSMLVPFLAFGDSPTSGAMVNVALWPVLLLSVGDITARLYGRRAALLAMALTATMPILVGLSHDILEDFEVVTAVALAIAILLRTRCFSSRPASLALGVALGLGALTKPTFLAYVIGPVAIVGVGAASLMRVELRDAATRRAAIQRLANAMDAALICLIVAAAWFLPQLGQTLAYIGRATAGTGAIGQGPSNPLTPASIAAYTIRVMDRGVSLPIMLAGIVAFVAVVPRWLWTRGRVGPSEYARRLGHAALLVSWVGLPYVVLASARNQDLRYIAPALPAVGIATAALVVAIPNRVLRWTAAAVPCLAGVILTVGLTWPFAVPLIPAEVGVSTPLGSLYFPISAVNQIGSTTGGSAYERPAQPTDFMTPVMAYLHAETAVLGRGRDTVCLLETDNDVNDNTLDYLADARGETFAFRDVLFTGSAGGLHRSLLSCDLALFVPALPASSTERDVILNQGFAAPHMTAQDLAVFGGPARWFPIDFGERLEVLAVTPADHG